MEIVLKKGESIDIMLEGADGRFRFTYGYTRVDVRATMPDSQGREGLIYREQFGGISKVGKIEAPADNEQ
jgi:hypothetical protein